MDTFRRIEASENESYNHMMSFEMRYAPAFQGANATMKRKYSWGAARCGMPTEASQLLITPIGGYFSADF